MRGLWGGGGVESFVSDGEDFEVDSLFDWKPGEFLGYDAGPASGAGAALSCRCSVPTTRPP